MEESANRGYLLRECRQGEYNGRRTRRNPHQCLELPSSAEEEEERLSILSEEDDILEEF